MWNIPEKSVRSFTEAPSVIRSGMMVDDFIWPHRTMPWCVASAAGDMDATISGVIPPGPGRFTMPDPPCGGVRASNEGFGTLLANCVMPCWAEKCAVVQLLWSTKSHASRLVPELPSRSCYQYIQNTWRYQTYFTTWQCWWTSDCYWGGCRQPGMRSTKDNVLNIPRPRQHSKIDLLPLPAHESGTSPRPVTVWICVCQTFEVTSAGSQWCWINALNDRIIIIIIIVMPKVVTQLCPVWNWTHNLLIAIIIITFK